MIKVSENDKKFFTIDFIRHSITEGNLKVWHYGWLDIPLADEGVALLHQNSEKGIYPSCEGKKLYTSGMVRTEQTFELIYGKRPHEMISELKELNFGEFEGHTYEELKERPQYIQWIENKTDKYAMPGGESKMQFRNRVAAGLKLLLDRAEDALVVCHGGVISVIMSECFGYDPEKGIYAYLPDPAHGYTVRFECEEDGEIKAVGYEGF